MPQELEQKSRSPAPSHTAPLSNARVRSWHLSRHTPRPSAPTASKQASNTTARPSPASERLTRVYATQYPILPPTQRGKGGHAQAYRVRGRRGPTRCRINRAGASWQPCCRQGGPLSVETQHSTARHGTAHSMLAQWSAPATVVTSHRSGGRDGGGEREGRCRPTHRAGDTVLYSQRPEAAAFYPRLAKLLPLHALSTQVSKQAIQPRNAERYEIVQIEAQPHPIGQAHERR